VKHFVWGIHSCLKLVLRPFLQDIPDEPAPEQSAILDFHVFKELLLIFSLHGDPILWASGWHASRQYYRNGTLNAGWPFVWKTWKCQGIWQLSVKCRILLKVGEKILSGKSGLKTVYCQLHICIHSWLCCAYAFHFGLRSCTVVFLLHHWQ